MIKKEKSVNAQIEVEVAESAKTWRDKVREAEEKLSEILGEHLELAKKQVQNEEVCKPFLERTMMVEVNVLAASWQS